MERLTPGVSPKSSALAMRGTENSVQRTACSVQGAACRVQAGRWWAGDLFGTVDGWVEGGVVVHLELAVDFEAAGAGEDVGPELVEAGNEVVALFGEEGEAFAVALAMAVGSFGAGGLFVGVVELESEDGEAVDHEAGALGVERGGGVGQAAGGEGFEEAGVAALGEVVAALVEAVDGALDFGEIVVGGAGYAGAVFGMPEIEVGAMLGDEDFEEGISGGGLGRRWEQGGGGGVGLLVPEDDGAVVKGGDLGGGERKREGHGMKVPKLW